MYVLHETMTTVLCTIFLLLPVISPIQSYAGTRTEPETNRKTLLTVKSSNDDTPICRLVRNGRKSFVEQISKNDFLDIDSIECRITDNCNEVTCSALTQKEKTSISGTVYLHICNDSPWIEFSADYKNETWSRKFEPKQVPQNSGPVFQMKTNHPFAEIENYLMIYDKNIYLNISLNLCKKPNDCEKTTFLSIPGMHVNALCHFGEENQNRITNELRRDAIASNSETGPSPSSTLNAEKMHFNGKSGDLSGIGQSCDMSDFYACGDHAKCVPDNGKTKGTCQCFPDYVQSPVTHECEHAPDVNPTTPVPGTSKDDSGSTLSAVIGAILSILMLVIIAGVIFLGVKYHVFVRLSRRIPVFSTINCWPFRSRSQGLSQDVNMVNPIGPFDDDDDPPLA